MAHWGQGLVTWLGRLRGEAPELQVRGGLRPVRGIPAGYGCSGCVVILTLVLLFVGVSFTQLLHWSHRGAAGLSLGPCRAQPRLVQRTVKDHVG